VSINNDKGVKVKAGSGKKGGMTENGHTENGHI
jgi:hypothetical protein